MILARFRDLETLQHAARQMRQERGGRIELFAPYEFESEGGSWVPLVILLAGLAGACGFFLFQAWSDTVAWRMNIGGRPDFSWPVYVANAFEVGILCAMAAGLVALFIASGMPLLFAPVDRFTMFHEASRHGFFLLVETDDSAEDRALLERLQPMRQEQMG